jgi:glycosyltransferase involved in cell wall biosynthesis
LGLEDGVTVVGWVGRFIPVKGGDLFLEALSLLSEPRPTAVMIGYGLEADRLRRRASKLGIGAAVRFYPDIRDAGRFFAAFDTYVLSSRSEGLPIVILEAMAARTPIVATQVGGIPDALSDGEAWLVPPDDPAALAIAIAHSLRDRDAAAARVARAADRLATDFAVDTWLDRYEAVYHAVMQRVEGGRSPSGRTISKDSLPYGTMTSLPRIGTKGIREHGRVPPSPR